MDDAPPRPGLLERLSSLLSPEPEDRDELIAKGYMQKGVQFVVHNYEAHLVPQQRRDEVMAAL